MTLSNQQGQATELRVETCSTPEEWKAAKYYRQKYFFDKQPIDDPYTWTFEHDDHRHFVLYQGTEIVGYAHVQLWPEGRAAIRIIIIDEDKRNKALGSYFMGRVEKWLRTHGVRSLHAEASPEAVNFYKKLGYAPMPFNDPDGYEGSEEDVDLGKVF